MRLLVKDWGKPERRKQMLLMRKLMDGVGCEIIHANLIHLGEVDGVRLKARVHSRVGTEGLVLTKENADISNVSHIRFGPSAIALVQLKPLGLHHINIRFLVAITHECLDRFLVPHDG